MKEKSTDERDEIRYRQGTSSQGKNKEIEKKPEILSLDRVSLLCWLMANHPYLRRQGRQLHNLFHYQ